VRVCWGWFWRILLCSLLGPVSAVFLAPFVLVPVSGMFGLDPHGDAFLALAWWAPAEMVLSFIGLLLVGLPASWIWKESLLGRWGRWITRLVGLAMGALLTVAFGFITHFPANLTAADVPELSVLGAPFGVAVAQWWLYYLRKLLRPVGDGA
jgi:hypothetical protein